MAGNSLVIASPYSWALVSSQAEGVKHNPELQHHPAEQGDRMPVILDSAERDDWLSGSDRTDLGAAYSVRHHPVTRFGIADEGEALIEPTT